MTFEFGHVSHKGGSVRFEMKYDWVDILVGGLLTSLFATILLIFTSKKD